MDDGATFQEVDLTAARIGRQFSMGSSTFSGELNMNGTEVGQDLFMDDGATFQEVDLSNAKIGRQFSMGSSTFSGELSMDGIQVAQSLLMDDGATFQEVELSNARIGGQLSMRSSTFSGDLDMVLTEVGQHLFMDGGATFQEVDLSNAKIEGQLSMASSTFKGRLQMRNVEVGQDLLMDDEAIFREVRASYARIGGAIIMERSIFNGDLNLPSMVIGSDLYARSTKFPLDREVNLIFAKIGANLDLSGATITAIDLTGTTIAGELRLGSAIGHAATEWVGASRMVLHKTTVGRIQDANPDLETDPWPSNLELTGFSCHHLGGLGAAGAADMAKRPSAWFIEWIKRDTTFSPHPYKLFADLLREDGYPSKASDILFAGRERARVMAWRKGDWPLWSSMTFLKHTIGYGLGRGYLRIARWIFALILLGFLILWSHLPAADRDFFTLFWASVDWLLPLVELDAYHKQLFNDLELSKLELIYFYIHKMVGYVVFGYLAAGLAGLTKKI